MRHDESEPMALDVGSIPPSTATSEQLLGLMLNVIQAMDKRLERLEDRLITNENKNQKSQQGGFPQFCSLPAELRQTIWTMCIPRRKLRVYNPGAPRRLQWRGSNKHPALGLPPPAISRVCQESRMVATKTGGMHRLAYRPEYWSAGYWKDFPPVYWTWFDRLHDILELERWCGPGSPDQPTGLWRLMSCCATILVREQEVDEDWVDLLFDGVWVREHLKTILITPNRPEVVNKLGWGEQLVGEFFGLDSVVMVDLADQDKALQVRNRLVNCDSVSYTDFENWFDKWQEKIGSGITTQACAKAENVFTSAWTTATAARPEPQTNGTSTREQEIAGDTVKGNDSEMAENQEPMESMPRIKTVYLFELEDERRPTIYGDYPARTAAGIRD